MRSRRAGRRLRSAHRRKVDQRPLGRVDEVGGPLDLFFVVRGHGADLFRLLGSKLADRSRHILGDVHEDGAFAAALRNAERGPHGVGQVFDLRTVKLCLVMGIVMPSM